MFSLWCPKNHWDIKQGFFQQFWEKAPGQNWEKTIDLTAKLGEINDIEHNNISSNSSYFRLYNANNTTKAQVFKYHSDMGHCFS